MPPHRHLHCRGGLTILSAPLPPRGLQRPRRPALFVVVDPGQTRSMAQQNTNSALLCDRSEVSMLSDVSGLDVAALPSLVGGLPGLSRAMSCSAFALRVGSQDPTERIQSHVMRQEGHLPPKQVAARQCLLHCGWSRGSCRQHQYAGKVTRVRWAASTPSALCEARCRQKTVTRRVAVPSSLNLGASTRVCQWALLVKE